MKDIWPDDFKCPQCGKTPENNAVIGIRNYSVRRLDLPYFLCGNCRICFYSKQLLRHSIRRWRKDNAGARAVSYSRIYKESKETLEEILKYYMKSAGYRFGRFKRK